MFMTAAIFVSALLSAAPIVPSNAQAPRQGVVVLGESMLICEGKDYSDCVMQCGLKFKQCHGGKSAKIKDCREQILMPCLDACKRDCS